MNSIWKTGPISLGLGWANVVFGAWLIISPFVLGLSKTAVVNNIITGSVLILLTLASRGNGLLRMFIILLGGWLYASAFALNASDPHRVAYIANGLILSILVLLATVASESPYPEGYRPEA